MLNLEVNSLMNFLSVNIMKLYEMDVTMKKFVYELIEHIPTIYLERIISTISDHIHVLYHNILGTKILKFLLFQHSESAN